MSARQVTRAKASTVWCSAGVPSRRVATWPARGNATSLHGRGNVLVPGRHGGVLVAKAKAASAEGSKAGLKSPLRTGPPRLALPSKGRMAEDTLSLLKSCQLAVRKPNPRQYVAEVPNLPGLEVWFQRASDIVRRLNYGDVDIGFIGYDMFHEFADGNDDLVIVHDALRYGGCHLALGVPTKGDFASVHSMEDLKGMGWSKENPLKVVTGYHNTAKAFFAENGMADSVTFLAADGALEAAPYMGCADIILDLVSTGTTLRENNLREIIGGG